MLLAILKEKIIKLSLSLTIICSKKLTLRSTIVSRNLEPEKVL